MTLEKGKRIPNWTFTLTGGERKQAWDWRQKSHLVLIVAPESTPDEQTEWQKGIESERKQWLWLNAEVFVVVQAPADLPPGVHAIDRYGLWIRAWPLGQWTFEDIQREYMYYEARHC
jgi:hypothetical protein